MFTVLKFNKFCYQKYLKRLILFNFNLYIFVLIGLLTLIVRKLFSSFLGDFSV